MKKHFPYSALIILSLLTACNQTASNKASEGAALAAGNSQFSPIEGNWELVSNEVRGKKVSPKRTQQFKVFNDGFFSYMMYDSLGNFQYAGAGPYEVNGNTYKETFAYSSDTTYIGCSDWQRWEMKEDTLIFYGFEKVVMADGEDVTNRLGRLTFVEKRVRAKR